MITRQQVDLFTKPAQTMVNGLWFSGIKYEEWYENGQLVKQCFYKNDKVVKNYLK